MSFPSGQRAFTLIEMVLSLAIASILALAVNSAIYIATRSIPTRGDAMSTSSDLLFLDDVLRTDLELATAIISATATSVEFEVPDRNGDDIAERIELDWSNIAGDPLLQRVNSGSWSPVVGRVDDLAFTTANTTLPVFTGTQTPSPSPVTINGRFTSGGWSPLNVGKQIAVQVDPSIPAGTSWRLTGVDLYMRWDGSGADDVLEVSAGRDVFSVSDPWRHTMLELAGGTIVSGGAWITVPLRTPWLDRNESIKIRILNKAGDAPVSYRMKTLSAMPTGLLLFTELFGSWTTLGLTSCAIEVRYETMVTGAVESDTLAIESVKLDMGFGTGVSDAALTARPLAAAKDLR